MGRWPLYSCRAIPSLAHKKMILNKLENILEHMHLRNSEHVLYMLLSTETMEDIYLLLILAVEHRHSAQVFFHSHVIWSSIQYLCEPLWWQHLNKLGYIFISDRIKLFSSDKTAKQGNWGCKTPYESYICRPYQTKHTTKFRGAYTLLQVASDHHYFPAYR